jgi:HEPN domain-containing protein
MKGERYPYVIFLCHLAIEKSLKALYAEKFQEIPTKTHNLMFLIEMLDLEVPQHFIEPLFVISRLGVKSRYPHNLETLLEQYTKEQTLSILTSSKEFITWLRQRS